MRTVLITGTSTGIGQVTAKVLASRGWHVFATMRNLAKKAPLEKMLAEDNGAGRVTFVALDVTDPASIEAAVANVLAQTGGTLDAVVHNAGVAIAGAHEDLPDAEIRRVMETNFFGVLGLTRAFVAHVPRAGTRAHRLYFQPIGLRGAADEFDLLRVEMGAGGLGGVHRIRAGPVWH